MLATSLALAIAGSGLATAARADEAQARELVKAMSDYLAAQQTISFNFDSSLEIVTTDDQKLTIASSGSLAMERPDKLRVTRRGGFASVEAVFDGTTLSLANTDAKAYVQAELPGTVEQLIDRLRDEFKRPLPAADLLLPDVKGSLLPLFHEVKDLGSGVIHGVECDHVAFRADEVDWQLWIAQGETPYPCRFTITSKKMTGWPQYTLDVTDWGAGSAPADFAFVAPEGAKKVEVADLPDFDEVAGIYSIEGGQ